MYNVWHEFAWVLIYSFQFCMTQNFDMVYFSVQTKMHAIHILGPKNKKKTVKDFLEGNWFNSNKNQGFHYSNFDKLVGSGWKGDNGSVSLTACHSLTVAKQLRNALKYVSVYMWSVGLFRIA